MTKINLPSREIIRKYQNGMSANELAKEYYVSKPTIGRLLKREEIKIRHGSEAYLGKVLPAEEIIKKYQGGMNTYELAKEYNVSDSTIGCLLKNAGVKMRRLSEARFGKILPSKNIITQYQNGMSMPQLSKQYRISEHAITNLLKKENIKIRHGSEAKLRMILPSREIAEKYQNGMNTVELAKEYNVTYPTIKRLLQRNDIKLRILNSNLEEALRAFGEQTK